LKVSDYIADFLYTQGIKNIFEVAGGMITHIIDSIYQQGKIRLVSVHHEQAAAFAADAVGRITATPGVAMATSGPGAINLLNGIGSCYFDSSPGIFITGQVNRNEQKGSRSIRQMGFQEADILSMVKPITKAAWLVSSPEEVPQLLKESFILACSGRPGPVLLDIPMDIQRADILVEKPVKIKLPTINSLVQEIVDKLIVQLCTAQYPLILAGGGIQAARAIDVFRKFIEQIKIPVVNSLMAVDVLPYNHPMRLGMLGTYGNRWVNKAIGLSDFILVIGSRLDVRQTGSDTKAFKGDRVIYHVDCEESEINNRVTDCIPVVSDLYEFLTKAIEISARHSIPQWSDWLIKLCDLRSKWPDTNELQDIQDINPNVFMHQLAKVSMSVTAFVTDVGQNQMWAAQSLELEPDQRFLTSGGMGSMGYALPASIGVAFSCPDKPVLMIAGDGGFQMNIQELQTISSNNLPIKMVILNNNCYGMVRQFQQSYFEERYPSTYWGYSAPDFASVAQAYEIPAFTIEKPQKVEEGLYKLWQEPEKPALIQVMLDPYTNIYPKVAFGKPITEMEPFIKPFR
jgi:acetolactate synthase-1/2/3 large subunit